LSTFYFFNTSKTKLDVDPNEASEQLANSLDKLNAKITTKINNNTYIESDSDLENDQESDFEVETEEFIDQNEYIDEEGHVYIEENENSDEYTDEDVNNDKDNDIDNNNDNELDNFNQEQNNNDIHTTEMQISTPEVPLEEEHTKELPVSILEDNTIEDNIETTSEPVKKRRGRKPKNLKMQL
jgi:hypothetical protein